MSCKWVISAFAFCPRKKFEISGKNPPKISGGAHTPEVWNLSRDPRRASSDTGSAPLPPSGEEIFGVKVFAFPLNSPKMGGQRGEPMVLRETTRGDLQTLRDSPRSGEKFFAERRFNIEPHRLRPGVSYGEENTKSESIPTLLHTLRGRSRGG